MMEIPILLQDGLYIETVFIMLLPILREYSPYPDSSGPEICISTQYLYLNDGNPYTSTRWSLHWNSLHNAVCCPSFVSTVHTLTAVVLKYASAPSIGIPIIKTRQLWPSHLYNGKDGLYTEIISIMPLPIPWVSSLFPGNNGPQICISSHHLPSIYLSPARPWSPQTHINRTKWQSLGDLIKSNLHPTTLY